MRRQAGGYGDPPGQARPGEGHLHPPLYRLSGDDRGGAAHSGGHCHGERNPRGDRPLLHCPRRQRHHRKAHGHVHGGRRCHCGGCPGPPCQGVRLPPEPVQSRGPGHPEGPGGGPVRQALPRLHPCALEPEQGLLRPGPLARHLGPGRRLHDEPVHPWRGSSALDDGG